MLKFPLTRKFFMNFAKIAKSLREETGLSQQKLADKLGISSSGIAHLELSESEPKSSTLIAYSKYFDVSTDYLLGLEDDFGTRTSAPMSFTVPTSNELTTKEKALLQAFNNLLPETQDFILRTTQSLSDKDRSKLLK